MYRTGSCERVRLLMALAGIADPYEDHPTRAARIELEAGRHAAATAHEAEFQRPGGKRIAIQRTEHRRRLSASHEAQRVAGERDAPIREQFLAAESALISGQLGHRRHDDIESLQKPPRLIRRLESKAADATALALHAQPAHRSVHDLELVHTDRT